MIVVLQVYVCRSQQLCCSRLAQVLHNLSTADSIRLAQFPLECYGFIRRCKEIVSSGAAYSYNF